MKCAFCDTEILDKPISAYREVHALTDENLAKYL